MLDLPTLNFNFIRNAWARRSLWLPALLLLWLLYIGFNVYGAIDSGISLTGATFASLNQPQPAAGQFGSAEGYYFRPPAGAPFALNLWGLWSGLFFGLVIVPNRRGMKNWWRFALGGGMLAMMLGRVLLGSLVGLFNAYVPVESKRQRRATLLFVRQLLLLPR